MLQYWDSYVRVDGEWCFQRRRFHRWYIVDALTRPSHGAGVDDGESGLTTHQLPEAFPSWDRFWSSLDQSERLTRPQRGDQSIGTTLPLVSRYSRPTTFTVPFAIASAIRSLADSSATA